jgi:type II secretory pathway component PulF
MTEATDEVIDDVTDVTEYNYTTDDTPVKLTEDDYFREKARREKAEKTLVEQKRKLKELESKSSDSSNTFTKEDYAMEKFLDKNPELSEYTKELSEYTKKGLSLEDAKTLVLNSDKAKQNRDRTNSLGLSD